MLLRFLLNGGCAGALPEPNNHAFILQFSNTHSFFVFHTIIMLGFGSSTQPTVLQKTPILRHVKLSIVKNKLVSITEKFWSQVSPFN